MSELKAILDGWLSALLLPVLRKLSTVSPLYLLDSDSDRSASVLASCPHLFSLPLGLYFGVFESCLELEASILIPCTCKELLFL